jgi:hypothetical protein
MAVVEIRDASIFRKYSSLLLSLAKEIGNEKERFLL